MFQAAKAITAIPNQCHPGKAVMLLDRIAIEAAIEHLIEALDLIDGDADVEDDDPAGHSLDRGEDDGIPRGMDRPRYGIDQSQGPINERQAHQKWLRQRA